MDNCRKNIMVLIAGIVLSASTAFGGTIVLDSGTKVEGEVSEQSNKVRVETQDGTYTFNKALVKSIDGNNTPDPVRRRQPAKEKTKTVNAGAVERKETSSESIGDLGRGRGPVRKVKTRFYVVSPVYSRSLGGGNLRVQRTTHYVRGWDTTGDRDEPVIGTIKSGTSIGQSPGGGLRFSSSGEPRFRTFTWETDAGERKIQLPTQSRIKVRTTK